MKSLKNYRGISILIILVTFAFSANHLFAAGGMNGFHPRKGVMSQLTDEQRTELQQKMKELRDSGATKQEIHRARKKMLNEFGVKFPEFFDRQGFGPRLSALDEQLTQTQRAELRAKVKEMREQNAKPEAIHSAVGELLKSYGVDLPESWDQIANRKRFQNGKWFGKSQLSEEQRNELREKVKALRESNASPAEIRRAVAEFFKANGIERSANMRKGKRGSTGFGLKDQLNQEQRNAIQEKVKELREQGKSRKEIHTAIQEMLKGYGVDLLGNFRGFRGQRMNRRHHLMGFVGKQMTDEQRAAIREKVREMKEQGATRQEIRKKIREMMKSFGVEFGDKMIEKEGLMEETTGNALTAENYPNPFNPETTIEFTLQKSQNVQLRIFNVQGQIIKTLVNNNLSAGSHFIKWDGHNDSGELVPSGIYFYQLKTGTGTLTRRMFLAK